MFLEDDQEGDEAPNSSAARWLTDICRDTRDRLVGAQDHPADRDRVAAAYDQLMRAALDNLRDKPKQGAD